MRRNAKTIKTKCCLSTYSTFEMAIHPKEFIKNGQADHSIDLPCLLGNFYPQNSRYIVLFAEMKVKSGLIFK